MKNVEDAADFLRSTVIGALTALHEEFQESPLEAAEHLQAIIVGVVTKRAEFASLYDYALTCPKLWKDLKSGQRHLEVAQTWGESEASVRRARKKMRELGMFVVEQPLQLVQLNAARGDGPEIPVPPDTRFLSTDRRSTVSPRGGTSLVAKTQVRAGSTRFSG